MKKSILLLSALLIASCAAQPQRSNPDSPDHHRAKLHAELGAGYYSQNRMAVALEEFNEAIRIDAGYAPAYTGLGLVRAALGQNDMAEQNFQRALKLDPESSETHNNYGTFLCRLNRIDESLVEFRAALSNPLYETPELALLNAGICSLKKQDETGAEQYFHKALKYRPNLAQASYQLASLNFGRGQAHEAKKHFDQAMRYVDASPEMLWLGVQIERALGNRDAEASYSLLLKNKYPDSEQTKAMLADRP